MSLDTAHFASLGSVGALRDDGSVIPLGSSDPGCGEARMSDRLGSVFPRTAWATAVEPNAWAGVADARLLAVGMAGDRLDGLVLDDARGLQLASETEVVFGTTTIAPPKELDEPQVVFSRSAGGVYLLGGRVRGEPSNEIWFRPLPGGWERLDMKLDRDSVLAATYSFRDHNLWAVLEPRDTDKMWKLVQIDPRSGAVHTVHELAYRGGARPILSVDREGEILLSMARASETRQARFWEEGGAFHAQMLQPVTGRLHRPFIIDDEEYTRVIEASGHLTVERHAHLATVGAPLTCPCERGIGEHL